jgi:acyl-CoA synthetase (NDP forming)
MVARAKAAGIRVFGPNCMGLYVPEERIAFHAGFPTEPGEVFVISQSGANASDIIEGLAERGVRFSKAVSFGNGRDVAAAELFEYAASDRDTEAVVAYLEGVPDGPALLRALTLCAREKPTIVLKGGLTAAGARAVSSHTASLAGSTDIFDALCRQAGAMRVETMDELHDLLVAVRTRVRDVRGPRAVLVGTGGGFSVLSADTLARHGVDLPTLPEATQAAMREHVPVAGNSIRNPVDAGFLGEDRGAALKGVMEAAVAAEGFDSVFTTIGVPSRWLAVGRTDDQELPPDELAEIERRRTDYDLRVLRQLATLQERHDRPIVGVRRNRRNEDALAEEVLEQAFRLGVGVFPSVDRAARAVALLLRWRAHREGLPPIL